ncbi:MAG: uracil-DNA glycosylase [Thermoplasmata archaeon]|nr:uracil-DNA glycosylase [Thermoplasmata archaeon]
MVRIGDLNEEIRKCKKCRLSETRMNALCGEGNLNARLMLVAQAPGEKEDEEGKMFIGPSGKVLDDLLKRVGVDRKELYMTNLIKCMLPKYRKPKQDEIEICSKYLDEEIELIDPAVIVPLGYFATRYIFEKYGITLPPKEEFPEVYGTLLLAKRRKILPLQHPTALLLNPSIMEEMIRNYHKMRIVMRDCRWYPMCPLKRFYEEGQLSEEWIQLYCEGDWESCVRYEMEENGEPHPDWMLPDGSIDERLRKLA